jgi:predicted TPR repeat methyltransferase
MVDEAEVCWRRALELKPDSVRTHNNLGVALKQRGKLDEALASYRRALELKPDYAEAYNNLANALWEEGKIPEAEACWRRTIELRPDCTDAYSNLGMMLYERKRLAEAADILKQWLRYAPENPVARHMVAAFTGQDVPARAADEYVRSSFDHFARTFDVKLQRLDYRAPDLVMAAVAEALGDPRGELEVLDAGCGTGWCGPLLRPYARRLTGVDLSPAMIEQARARQVYDDLIVGELTAHLEAAAGRYDLVASADTLVYFGDLKPVAAAAAGALRSGGLLIFTVEKADPALHTLRVREPRYAKRDEYEGFVLQPHGRYCHTEDYVRRTLTEAGLTVRELAPGILRKEMGLPVQGIVASARKRGLEPP